MSIVITDPSVEPVTVAEVKEHLRIEHNDEDYRLNMLVEAARKWVEQITWRQLITTTIVVKMDCFPYWEIILPRPPLVSITSIAYVDSNGDAQTWGASNYTADTSSTPGRVTPAYNVTYPTTRNVIDAVTVTYTAGYGTAATDVPEPIRAAIMFYTQFLWSGCDTRDAALSLLSPYRALDERVLQYA